MQRAPSDSLSPAPITGAFSIYGAAVSLLNCCPLIDQQIRLFLSPFVLKHWNSSEIQMHGEIRPFDLSEVTHSLSSAAASSRHGDDLVDIYSDAERHWILDDRWGVCEIDLLKRRWRSWVIPQPSLDPVHLAEAAAIWPMAQLLRTRGIELVPAVAIERSGWGAMIIAPYPIPGEIARAIRAGYRIIGQRWTALVQRNERIVLQHLPGLIESPAARGRSIGRNVVWIDATGDNPWASADLAWCDAVLIVSPGRRVKSRGRVIPASEAQSWLRHAWPIPELPVDRPRLAHPAAVLAAQSLCLSVELSRNEEEFLQMLEYSRLRTPTRAQVTIHRALRRHFTAPTRIAV